MKRYHAKRAQSRSGLRNTTMPIISSNKQATHATIRISSSDFSKLRRIDSLKNLILPSKPWNQREKSVKLSRRRPTKPFLKSRKSSMSLKFFSRSPSSQRFKGRGSGTKLRINSMSWKRRQSRCKPGWAWKSRTTYRTLIGYLTIIMPCRTN